MQVSKIEVNHNLQEIKKHGASDLPIAVYNDDFSLFEEGYIRWHWHKELQISYVLSDKICFYIDGKEIVLEPQNGIMFNANVLHQIKPYNNNCSMFSIVFDSVFISPNNDSLIRKIYVEPILNNSDFKFIILKNEVEWQKQILEYSKYINRIFKLKEYGHELEIKNYLNLIWLTLVRNAGINHENNNEISKYDEDRVKIALKYINSNYSNNISLSDIAKAANISRSECCRSFKRVLKNTPFEYLMEYRILKSSHYLCNTNKSIANIAIDVGFNGISYYGKIFKKYMGCTPSQYRARYRK